MLRAVGVETKGVDKREDLGGRKFMPRYMLYYGDWETGSKMMLRFLAQTTGRGKAFI